MEIKELLAPSHVLVGVRAPDKVRLLQDLVRRAAVALNCDADVVISALLKREELARNVR